MNSELLGRINEYFIDKKFEINSAMIEPGQIFIDSDGYLNMICSLKSTNKNLRVFSLINAMERKVKYFSVDIKCKIYFLC